MTTLRLGTEDRRTDLPVEDALAGIKKVAKEHRAGLLQTLTDEGPSVIGCAQGRYLVMFAQGESLRVDKYDSTSKRVARYRL